MDNPQADDQLTPYGRRYERGANERGAAARRLWLLSRALVELSRENQFLLPVAGIAVGLVLALVLSGVGLNPEPGTWAVSVDRARDTLLGLLSLVFAGLSIVLAVATVTTQNVVGRFSLRLLRIYQRQFRDRFVISAFAMTATFIVVVQIRLRSAPPDDLAPVGSVAGAVVLLFMTGTLMIWYISALSAWFRVDRTARRVAKGAIQAARSLGQRYDDLEPAGAEVFERPSGASDIRAPRSGYLSGVDLDALFERAVSAGGVIVIHRVDGSSVHRGEPIGWIASLDGRSPVEPERDFADAIEVSGSLTLEGAVDYRTIVLADIAVMALSPAINDPNTAVQVIDELGFLFAELSTMGLGPVARVDDDGRPRIALRALSLSDYVELATTQIALYGNQDPAVRIALRRLFEVLTMLDLSEEEAANLAALAGRLEVPT
ncbi:MAG: DUF2254 family protein [Acidimicrobiales bacterium]